MHLAKTPFCCMQLLWPKHMGYFSSYASFAYTKPIPNCLAVLNPIFKHFMPLPIMIATKGRRISEIQQAAR